MIEARIILGGTVPVPVYLVESGDNRTPLTGAAPSALISPVTAGFMGVTGGFTEVGDGWYNFAPSFQDVPRPGVYLLHVEAAGAAPCDARFEARQTQDSPLLMAGVATYPLTFLMISATDHVSGLPGISPSVVISRAGGAFATPAGAILEVGGSGNGFGWYYVAPDAADTASRWFLLLHATGAGADNTDDAYEVAAAALAFAPPSLAGGMRRPSGRMRRNSVAIARVADWTRGQAGGRKPAYLAPGPPVRCQVAAATSEEVPDHMRDTGVQYLTVTFTDDPGTRLRDRLNWTDWSPPKILTVMGPTRVSSGRFRSFLVDCEYRPSKDESQVASPMES